MTSGDGPAPIDLTGRQPPWPKEASALWHHCLSEALRATTFWRTPPPAGVPALRDRLAVMLGTTPDHILVTTGVRAAVALLDRARPRPAYVERPGFSGIPHALTTPTELVGWSAMGMSGSEPALPARYLITAPCRNPDGADPPPTLLARLDALRRSGHEVVVNEVYRWAVPHQAEPAADWRVGSLAKVAGGGLRVGWLRGDPQAVEELTRHHTAVPPAAWQVAAAKFLEADGLELLNIPYVARPDACRRAFVASATSLVAGTAVTGGGPFVFLPVPMDETDAVAAIRRRGLLVGPGRDFLGSSPAVRLCFTDVSEDAATAAARRIAPVLNASPSRA
jgi:DNA-binding transcriptional MocR family regulator